MLNRTIYMLPNQNLIQSMLLKSVGYLVVMTTTYVKDLGLYSRKVVNGGRSYDDRTLSVRPAITIHKRNGTYNCRKFVRKFTTYLQLSYSES